MIYLSIIIATLAVQIPNIWAIHYFSTSPEWRSAFVIALACIPASVIATACYRIARKTPS